MTLEPPVSVKPGSGDGATFLCLCDLHDNTLSSGDDGPGLFGRRRRGFVATSRRHSPFRAHCAAARFNSLADFKFSLAQSLAGGLPPYVGCGANAGRFAPW